MLLTGAEPMIVRARNRSTHTVNDLVVRWETAGVTGGLSAACYVLHIDPHMVVTNRLVQTVSCAVSKHCALQAPEHRPEH